jgi:hypothetical protein
MPISSTQTGLVWRETLSLSYFYNYISNFGFTCQIYAKTSGHKHYRFVYLCASETFFYKLESYYINIICCRQQQGYKSSKYNHKYTYKDGYS